MTEIGDLEEYGSTMNTNTNSTMNWNAKNIRQLRLSMGWTQCELSRHLKTEMALVTAWEMGQSQPSKDMNEQLTLLAKHAEFSADVLSQTPLAELFLEESDLDQCELQSTKDKFIDN